ncbi:MAG: hypothetical protein ACLSVG_08795 [Clostridia bacterium]
MKCFMKKHKRFFVLLGALLLMGVASLAVHDINIRYIDMDKVFYITVTADIYWDNYSSEISDPDCFETVKELDRSVKKKAGYRFNVNATRWHVTFYYHYKNGKIKSHKYCGDKNFDEITRLIQDFQAKYSVG